MLYQSLQIKSYPLQIYDRWSADLGPISEEQWVSILGLTPKLSPCEAQQLSQLYLVHRVYKSPSRLHRIGVRADSSCPRCGLEDAHIMHMFWECTSLGGFWNDILNLIHSVHSIRLPTDPKTCILGLLGSVGCCGVFYRLLHRNLHVYS